MPRVTPDPDAHPQLRPWKVELQELDGEDVLEITCPWCDGAVIVLHPRHWKGGRRQRQYVGRSCTYCFKTCRVPSADEWKEIGL